MAHPEQARGGNQHRDGGDQAQPKPRALRLWRWLGPAEQPPVPPHAPGEPTREERRQPEFREPRHAPPFLGPAALPHQHLIVTADRDEAPAIGGELGGPDHVGPCKNAPCLAAGPVPHQSVGRVGGGDDAAAVE